MLFLFSLYWVFYCIFNSIFFFNQNEARRAENSFLVTQAPPPSPYLKVWIPHCISTHPNIMKYSSVVALLCVVRGTLFLMQAITAPD